ncbi:uncharacterized protein [Procambarus clarkii]|uniref:uncharacterized protein n=1 Tax=Procambarus clarkii TaxID=6728 RepID=UPI003741FEED
MDAGKHLLVPPQDVGSEVMPLLQHRDVKGTSDKQQEGDEPVTTENRTSGERIKFSVAHSTATTAPVDNPPAGPTLGINRKQDSILRKSSFRYQTNKAASAPHDHLTKKESLTRFTPGESAVSRKDSCGNIFSSQDRQSKRRKRKPSLMSITISQCSEAGVSRQFTQFEETPPGTPVKRDSISSYSSVAGPLLRPSIMAQGVMFSQCQREKQWFMAIHASHPDEAVPVLKKPVLFVDEGGNITKETVRGLV